MSSTALELHEVLEQEYVSSGGDLGSAPGPEIAAAHIRNLSASRVTLQSYLRGDYRDEAAVAEKLEWLRLIVDPEDPCCPARLFGRSPRLANDTAVLLERYEDDGVDPDDRRAINRRILDDVFADSISRFRDLRLAHLYAELHKAPDSQARTALCISGGGIRSATFALGVMQGLASRKLLHRFDYLSTVSGGGYIGSWLSSWVRRHPEGIKGVEEDLAAIDSGDGHAPKLEPEAKPIRHLRQYSNYLTPRIGILSGDTWAFLALYLRNLTINLLVLVPLLAAILAVPRFSAFLLNHISRMRLTPLMAFTDISMLAMYWYIGAARPVRHGSESDDGPRWLRYIPQAARFVIFCLLAGAGSATGVTLVWAKYVQLHAMHLWTPAHLLTMQLGVAFALGAMTLAPCVAYFRRYLRASYAARRESISSVDDNRRIRNNRIRAESASAVVAALGACALFWFFAVKVFDDPLGVFPDIDGVAPFQLAGLSLSSHRVQFVCFGAPVALLIFFLQATVFVAGSGKRNEDYDREWWGRAGGWLLCGGVAWMLLACVSIYGPLAIYHAPTIVAALGGVSGLIAIVLGRSPKSAATQKSGDASGAADKTLGLAVPLFCFFLLASISWLTTLIVQKVKHTEAPDRAVLAQFQEVASREQTSRHDQFTYKQTLKSKPLPMASPEALASLAHLRAIEQTTPAELAGFLIIAAAAYLASMAVGANRFSMHALYRNRLIRGYLGASRYDRDPDAVTGFDPHDNLQMYKLRPELLWASSFRKLDAFIGELREPSKPLSKRIISLLQPTTTTLLANTRIAERIDAFVLALDKHHDGDLQTEIQPLALHLASVAKRLAARKAGEAISDKERIRIRRDAATAKAKVLREGSRGDLIDALFQDLNRIILDEDLRETPSATVRPGRRPIENRQILDAAYGDWLVAMPHRPPMHIVNMALNVTSGSNLAWQQRQAASFTASPLHCGSPFLGYRDSRKYGDGRRGISLGTAVTISGAAASPNQGYHSSPALAFLLTMFNVRLGWWLGNPGAAGQETYEAENPLSPVALIGRELIGETDDRYKWVYLSDGGHFENLGLYEMILRRSRYVVVSDGGCDPKFTFEDLGNAIRKIRIDLGVPIKLEKMPMFPRGDDDGWSYCVVGEIDYQAVDGGTATNGKLVYFKPGYYRDDRLPKDVVNYAKESLDFPHETTADQWFSESQFESYRMLGRHAVDHSSKYDDSAPESICAFITEKLKQSEATETVYVPVVAQQIVTSDSKQPTTAVLLSINRQQPPKTL